VADARSVVDHLTGAGWSTQQIGAVGFCMGGRAGFLVAGHLPLGAAVGFYVGAIVTGRNGHMGALLDLVPRRQAPWLGPFGVDDQAIPVAVGERLRPDQVEHSQLDTRTVRYSG